MTKFPSFLRRSSKYLKLNFNIRISAIRITNTSCFHTEVDLAVCHKYGVAYVYANIGQVSQTTRAARFVSRSKGPTQTLPTAHKKVTR